MKYSNDPVTRYNGLTEPLSFENKYLNLSFLDMSYIHIIYMLFIGSKSWGQFVLLLFQANILYLRDSDKIESQDDVDNVEV